MPRLGALRCFVARPIPMLVPSFSSCGFVCQCSQRARIDPCFDFLLVLLLLVEKLVSLRPAPWQGPRKLQSCVIWDLEPLSVATGCPVIMVIGHVHKPVIDKGSESRSAAPSRPKTRLVDRALAVIEMRVNGKRFRRLLQMVASALQDHDQYGKLPPSAAAARRRRFACLLNQLSNSVLAPLLVRVLDDDEARWPSKRAAHRKRRSRDCSPCTASRATGSNRRCHTAAAIRSLVSSSSSRPSNSATGCIACRASTRLRVHQALCKAVIVA